MNPIRILAVDDDLDFRYLLTQMLLGQPDLELAAVCATAQEGCAAAVRLQPDIVLMDLELIGSYTDGADAARRIRMQTTARVLILTADDNPETVIRASVHAFASGYVLKSQTSMLLPTIRETATGPTPQSHLICAALLQALTVAERAVLRQMLGQEVQLYSSAKTIANQQTSVLHKLGLPDRNMLRHIFAAYLS